MTALRRRLAQGAPRTAAFVARPGPTPLLLLLRLLRAEPSELS